MDPTDQNQMDNNQNEGQEMQANSSIGGQEKQHQLGPIVGVIVIVALIIFGGLYIWNLQRDSVLQEIDVSADPVVEELGMQSSSDAVSDIETDIDATELDRLDEDFAEIERELGI